MRVAQIVRGNSRAVQRSCEETDLKLAMFLWLAEKCMQPDQLKVFLRAIPSFPTSKWVH